MKLYKVAFVILIACTSQAFAGITIHFKGTAVDEAAIEKISEIACAEAKKNSWRCQPVVGEEITRLDGITARYISEMEGSKYISKVKGVAVFMHEMSEPLYLVFGASRRIDNFVKTQFAGADVHIRAIELLQKLKPYFTTLEVVDEGGYWDTRDRQKLTEELEGTQTMMVKIKSEHPNAHGPVKRPDGRILDLIGK